MEFNIPTIVIGLGGTGLKTVVSLKRKIPKDARTLLKFFCIDSDKNEVLINELEPDEYLNVSVPGVSSIVGNLRSESAEFIRPWFPSNLNFKVVSGDEGAKQFRPMGRLYLFRNVDKVFNAIDMATKQLRAKFADVKIASKTINVYLISSTCGGTGSGMLLDVAYIVRKVIEEENAIPALIKGILFLPTAFHPFPISDEAEKKHIFANGYATLKEIDFYMNPNNESEYKVQFSKTRVVSSKKQPFDVCYLIDDENEEFPIGGLDDTIEAVSESLVILISSGVGTNIKSAEDNLYTVLSQSQKMQPYSHKNYLYSSFGTSSVIYPYEDVKRYVAGKLVKFMYDYLNKELKSNFVYDIVRQLKMDELSSDDLINHLYPLKLLSPSEISEKVYQIENKDLQLTIKEKIITYYKENTLSEIKERLEKNLDEIVKNKFEEFKKLMDEYISNPSVGFFLVYKVLTDSENGLIAYLTKVKDVLKKEIEEHNNRISKLSADLDFYSNALIEKSNSLINRLFNKKDRKLVEGVSKALSELSNHQMNSIIKEYAILFYNKFGLLLSRYIDEYIEAINNVWKKFYNDYISEYLKIDFVCRASSWGNRINFYVANREMIDKQLEMIIENDKNRINSNLYKLFDSFVNMKYDKFKDYEKALLDFVEENYKDYLYSDIEDQVINIFGKEEEVVSRLLRSSTILYRYDSQLFENSYVKHYKVMGVKDINKSRFFNTAKAYNIEVIENYNPYRISMLQVKHGLPLYAYVLIDVMEKCYLELVNTDPGLHIDSVYQKVENLTLENEKDQKEIQKLLYVYLSLVFELVRKEGLSFVVYIDNVKIDLGSNKQEVVSELLKRMNDSEFYSKFSNLVDTFLKNYGEESVKIILKEHLQKIGQRLYYLKNKKNLSKEEIDEMDMLEEESKVLKMFVETVKT